MDENVQKCKGLGGIGQSNVRATCHGLGYLEQAPTAFIKLLSGFG